MYQACVGLRDFAPLQPAPTVAGACKTVAGASVSAEQGEKRKWLKIYETLPNQLLNAYGAAKYIKMSDSDMWVEMKRPLATGAASMSELCFLDEERRGVGINRWLQVCESFCMYQQMPSTKQQNEAIMNTNMAKELYAEIDRILPSISFCLAPRKGKEKTGANLLRSACVENSGTVVQKPKSELEKHAKFLYEWLDPKNVSRIRMLMHWHSAGGLSYVAAVHHRGAQCFRECGNDGIVDKLDKKISLEEFQAAVVSRHVLGSSGIVFVDPQSDCGALA